jgi:hypothetical protein
MSEQYRKECLRRHYENMDKPRALRVLSELKTKNAKRVFKKRINYAKGYEFI